MKKEISRTQKALNIIFPILLVGSVAANVMMYNAEPEVKVEKEYVTEDIQPYIDLRVELEKEVEMTKSELEKYKGISEELDVMIAEANTTIKAKEKKIREMSKEANKSKENMDQLELEMAELEQMKDEYLDKIDDLLIKNDDLQLQNMSLDKTLAELQKENNMLKKKVNIGEMLIADNIVVTPLKENIFNKDVKSAMARKVKKLDVSFDILPNKLAKTDMHVAFMKIISPEGVVIFDVSGGSGYTKNPDTKVDMMYTKDKEFDYRHDKKQMNIVWETTKEYTAGTYIVELFNNKSMMGISSFTLK